MKSRLWIKKTQVSFGVIWMNKSPEFENFFRLNGIFYSCRLWLMDLRCVLIYRKRLQEIRKHVLQHKDFLQTLPQSFAVTFAMFFV